MVEGIEIDGVPVIFEAGHLNLGVLLYVLLNDNDEGLGKIPAEIKGRIKVSKNLIKRTLNISKVK